MLVAIALNDVYDIVTGGELWIHVYEPETKRQSTVWVFQNKPNTTKVDRAPNISKEIVICFFGKTRYMTKHL